MEGHIETALVATTEQAVISFSLAGIQVEENPAKLYLSTLTKDGQRTMGYRLRAVARLFGYETIIACRWADLRFKHVLAVRTTYLEKGLAPRTINTSLCALSGVARMAWKLGLLSYEEYARIKHVGKVKSDRLPPGRALSQEELCALFRVCTSDPNPARGARDIALLGILAGGGLRRGEATRLDLSDYDPLTGTLRVIGKGDKERLVYLHGGAKVAVEDWLLIRGDVPGPLLTATLRRSIVTMNRLARTAIYRVMIERAEEAGVERFMPHDLRRTFISDLLDAGADIVAISKLVGHEDTNTTARYDRRGERAKQKAAALTQIPYH